MAGRYGGYQYETSPRKLEPEYPRKKTTQRTKAKTVKQEKPKKEVQRDQIKLTKEQKQKQFKITATIIAIFAIIIAISYRNSLINESFTEVQNLKKDLASLQKENEQLQVNIQNSLNLNNLEQSAKAKLGMQKLSNKQIVYINIPKQDYVESATEEIIMEEEQSWFEKIVNKIFKNKQE